VRRVEIFGGPLSLAAMLVLFFGAVFVGFGLGATLICLLPLISL
jgi:hypothetical protein